MREAEVVAILEDRSKEIAGDLQWSLIGEHENLLGFRAEIASGPRWPIFVNASCALAGVLC
jgi:hypothetical protein